jgi:hypothetical protein
VIVYSASVHLSDIDYDITRAWFVEAVMCYTASRANLDVLSDIKLAILL